MSPGSPEDRMGEPSIMKKRGKGNLIFNFNNPNLKFLPNSMIRVGGIELRMVNVKDIGYESKNSTTVSGLPRTSGTAGSK